MPAPMEAPARPLHSQMLPMLTGEGLAGPAWWPPPAGASPRAPALAARGHQGREEAEAGDDRRRPPELAPDAVHQAAVHVLTGHRLLPPGCRRRALALNLGALALNLG